LGTQSTEEDHSTLGKEQEKPLSDSGLGKGKKRHKLRLGSDVNKKTLALNGDACSIGGERVIMVGGAFQREVDMHNRSKKWLGLGGWCCTGLQYSPLKTNKNARIEYLLHCLILRKKVQNEGRQGSRPGGARGSNIKKFVYK